MASGDTLFPDSVKDFVFDLHDASRRSLIPSEQQALYSGTFREVTAKYFPNVAWPSPDQISGECDGDPLFLALYDELTLRHLQQSVKRPSVRDRVEGWRAYRELFDLLVAEASLADDGGAQRETLYLVPEWCFDILHEFLYQFQGFCQFRTSTYTAAAKVADDPDDDPKEHVLDAINVLTENKDAWAIEKVMYYLNELVALGTRPGSSATYRFLAYFSSVTLSRLECLLGDYTASIKALDVIYDPSAEPVAVGEEMRTPEELVGGVFLARLSLAYHAGISFLMLRRHKDSARVLGGICLHMQRGLRTGQLRKIRGYEQFNKLYDRMIALLAIITHVCPAPVLDDSVAAAVSDKHAGSLSKVESGEEGYEDMFIYACPKFVSAAVPDYAAALRPGCPPVPFGHDAYKLQVQHFISEMAAHASLRKMRSYMTLYTSIGVDKLASFNDATPEDFVSLLLRSKHRMRQLERGPAPSDAKGGGPWSGRDVVGTAMDIHYSVSAGVIHVDEAEKTRRFETFFMKQIQNNDDILRQLEKIEVEL